MKYVFIGLVVAFILATLLPLVREGDWWIRIFDFPRGQIAAGGVLIFVVYVLVWDTSSLLEDVLFVLLLGCVGYQGWRMFPYTPLAPKEVFDAGVGTEDTTLSLLIANVLMTNRQANNLLELIATYDPDVVLTVEADAWWEEHLRPLEDTYLHTLKNPLDNTYGMLIHSRLEMIDPEIKFLVQDSIPSMHVKLRLPSGKVIAFHGVHPEPPYPRYAKETTERDAELLVIGKAVKEKDPPTIVAGDLNDVAWSHTTRLFQKISGLLDPRRGRGMYNTFHAENPLMRWPLDHVFHSDHFTLVHLERLPAWGSDHFPVFIKLRLEPSMKAVQKELEADGDEREEAEEKIQEAREQQAE